MGRLEPVEDRLWKHLKWEGECLVWQSPTNSDGYGTIGMGPGRGTEKVHRLYWILYRGPILNGLYVLHRCPRHLKTCVIHTYLGTHADNMRDASVDGTFARRSKGTRIPFDWKGRKRHGRNGKLIR
jgi:hypothetical protein